MFERLTRIDAGGIITGAKRGKGEYVGTQEMLERLYEYENSGLSPEEVTELKEEYETEKSNSEATYAIMCGLTEEVERLKKCLAEYEQAKAEGRLVVLPCKVGDTVYEITREDCDYEDCPDEYHDRVDEVYIDQITCEIFENEVEIKLNDYLDIKDAYPTYEAAEKALPTCNVTKLPCAGCNPCCEHKEE